MVSMAQPHELEDGWILSERNQEESEKYYRFIVDHAVPRPGSILYQARTDLKAPKSIFVWATALLLLIYGAITRNLSFVLPGLAIIALLGPTFWSFVRLRKYGHLVVVQADKIIGGCGDGAIMSGVFNFKNETKKIEVFLINSDKIPVMLTAHKYIEICTLVDLKNIDDAVNKKNAGIAFRIPRGIQGELSSPLPKAIATSA